ncbi:MAG: AtpZ/AtpI family protein [Bacteroidales bacterium]|nr:AtpZ/AtpI family protein [Bacteroidales bacterium]MCF8390982.1 AtpZ/AtpI family protein [Bacteroidales bacterium]
MKKHQYKNPPKKSKNSKPVNFGLVTGMAFQMIAIILLSVWAGIKIDEKFQREKPLFLIFFAIFGVFIALYVALKDFVKFK